MLVEIDDAINLNAHPCLSPASFEGLEKHDG